MHDVPISFSTNVKDVQAFLNISNVVSNNICKPTTCKEAIRRWEEENGQHAATATEIILSFQWPPIEKMDNALATLVNCEKLSLSTNMIEKIAGIIILIGKRNTYR